MTSKDTIKGFWELITTPARAPNGDHTLLSSPAQMGFKIRMAILGHEALITDRNGLICPMKMVATRNYITQYVDAKMAVL
jgi:hypothetical protein